MNRERELLSTNMILLLPSKPPQFFHRRPSHAAAALHLLLLLGAALAMAQAGSTASAHAVHTPCCDLLQGVNLVPCLSAMAGSSGAAVNISVACCASLNQVLDAGRSCLCSLLLANSVLAGLVATLVPALPLVLPLPGCYLYAPPLAACQVTLLQTNYESPAAAATASEAASVGEAGGGTADSPPLQMNYESPAAAASEVASVGDAGGGASDSPPPQAAVTPPPPKNGGAAAGTKDGRRTEGSAGDGSRVESVRRSDASHRRPGVGVGRTYYLLIPVVVMAVFWFNHVAAS